MFHVFSMLTLPWDTAASSSFAAAHQDDDLGDYSHNPGLFLQLQAHKQRCENLQPSLAHVPAAWLKFSLVPVLIFTSQV